MRPWRYYVGVDHLRHLEDHGIITSRPEGRKRLYTLTPRGRATVRFHEHLIFFLNAVGGAKRDRPENLAHRTCGGRARPKEKR